MSTDDDLTPLIYVASLSDYVAGRLHGVHIKLDGRELDEVWGEVQKMLKSSRDPGAEEWAIHDHENFGKWDIGEYADMRVLVLAGQAAAELNDDTEHYAFMYWMSQVCTDNRYDPTHYLDDVDGWVELFRNEYVGRYDDLKSWLQDNDNPYVDMVLGLDGLKHAAEEFDESHARNYGRIDRDSQLTTRLDRLVAYIDWDYLARDFEHLIDGLDVEKAGEEAGYGVFVFVSQS